MSRNVFTHFSFIMLLFMIPNLSCVSTHDAVLQVSTDVVAVEQVEVKDLPESFVLLVKIPIATVCGDTGCATLPAPDTFNKISASSSIVFSAVDRAVVLTASHFCAEEESDQSAIDTLNSELDGFIVTDIDYATLGIFYDQSVLGLSRVIIDEPGFDMCLLEFKTEKPYPALTIATEQPSYGDTVLNMASPEGAYFNGMPAIFSGAASGEALKQLGTNVSGVVTLVQVFTIPVTVGSSGSPILNGAGELVGMIHSQQGIALNQIAFSPSLANIQLLLSIYVVP